MSYSKQASIELEQQVKSKAPPIPNIPIPQSPLTIQ